MADEDENEFEVAEPEDEAGEQDGEESGEREPLILPMDGQNLCFQLLEDEKEGVPKYKRLADKVYLEFKADWEGHEQYRRDFWEDWKTFAMVFSKKNWPFEGCLSRDSEILTSDGWKNITEVAVGDSVLTRRDEDGLPEWNEVYDLVRPFREKMVSFRGRSIDMLVTEDHEMVVYGPNGKAQRMLASELAANPGGWSIPQTSNPVRVPNERLFDCDASDVAELVGWYLAEGSSSRLQSGERGGSLFIAQSREANPGKCDRLESLFSRLGISWSYCRHSYTLHARSIPTALLALLRSQGRSWEKRIPEPIKRLGPDALGALLSGLIAGDGVVRVGRRGVGGQLYTTSPGLADDVQEVAQLAGMSATISRRQCRHNGVDGRMGYVVSLKTSSGVRVCRLTDPPEIVEYNDVAFCVTVKNHSIYVRRNGIAAWTGNCANINLPMARENFIRVLTRMMTEVFGNFDDIAVYESTGPDDEVAQPLTEHTNFQLRREVPGFRREMEVGGLLFWIPGDVTFYSYYDEELREICHETLSVDEFVPPYASKSRRPDYGDLTHYTRVLNMYPHDLRARRDEWVKVEEVISQPATHDDEPEQGGQDAARAVHGVDVPSGDYGVTAPHRVLQYEGWDDEILGFGRDVWIRCYLDYKTQTLMSVEVLEIPDWRDEERHRLQMSQLEQYVSQVEAAQVAQERTGEVQEQLSAIGQAFGAPPPPAIPEPQPPGWMETDDDGLPLPPAPPRMVPLRMFTHGVCVENIGSVLGLGFGRMQRELNVAANTMLNQTIDAATIANIGFWFKLDSIQLPENIDIKIGKWINVPGIGTEELQHGIRQITGSQPQPHLSESSFKLMDVSQSSLSAPDVLSGAEGKSGETWRGMATRVDQAVKQLSYLGKKFASVLEHLLSNHAYLNSVYLDDEVFAGYSAGSRVLVKREWYRLGYRATVRSDLSFTPRAQRISEADEILQMVMQLVPLTPNPALLYQAIKDSLVARGKKELVQLLGAPPPTPPQFPTGNPAPPPGTGAQGVGEA